MNSTPNRTTTSGEKRGFTSLELETTIPSLPTSGRFPEWLRGSLYRNGPGKFEVGSERYEHWFDGLGMLHRFTIAEGRVSYANRFLASHSYREAERTGGIGVSQFATKARLNPLQRLKLMRNDPGSQNANVNIVPCGDDLLALTETPTPMAFDALTLETLGARPFTDRLGAQTITAHPHHDAARGRSINLATKFGPRCSYDVVAIADGTLERTLIGSILTDHPSYLHTFAVTQTHAIVVEFPFVLGSAIGLALGTRAFIDNFAWEPGRGTIFHAMRLDDGTVAQTWQGAPFFAFHHINAFDDGDAIVLDVSAYEDAAVMNDLRLDALRDPLARTHSATFRRYRLDPQRATADFETLAPVATELPRLNARHFARDYAFAYGIAATPERPDALSTALVKVATADGAVKRWTSDDAYPGEPVFVARPGASAEDDGHVLSVVLDGTSGTSYLLGLDAGTFEEVGRATLPHHVPFGFHGLFVRS